MSWRIGVLCTLCRQENASVLSNLKKSLFYMLCTRPSPLCCQHRRPCLSKAGHVVALRMNQLGTLRSGAACGTIQKWRHILDPKPVRPHFRLLQNRAGIKVRYRLWDYFRQVEAEMVSNNRNKICQTLSPLLNQPLHRISANCPYYDCFWSQPKTSFMDGSRPCRRDLAAMVWGLPRRRRWRGNSLILFQLELARTTCLLAEMTGEIGWDESQDGQRDRQGDHR